MFKVSYATLGARFKEINANVVIIISVFIQRSNITYLILLNLSH